MKPLLKLKNISLGYNLTKAFGKSQHEVLSNIDLDIFPGDRIGVIGANGSGKSSLLKIMNGTLNPDSGSIKRYNSIISLLTLTAGFDDHLNGHDNAIYLGMLQGFSHKHMLSQMKEIHNFSELQEFFYQPIRTYSTGMRSRLAISIGINLDPDIFLLDEVLSVGDFKFKIKSEKNIAEKINKKNKAAVIISHSDIQIERFCNKAILLKNNTIFAEGRTTEVLKIYKKS